MSEDTVPLNKIEEYNGGLIQHGTHNDRIYLMRAPSVSSPNLPHELIKLAEKNHYSKIFAKTPASMANDYFNAGFLEEARIPGFISGSKTALFMGYYLNAQRREEPQGPEMDEILKMALEKKTAGQAFHFPDNLAPRPCNETDVCAMAKLYRAIFASYPFPIYDSDYLLETMQSHIDYFGIKVDGEWIALSSAEMDVGASNVEMTDFAVLQKWRGNRLAERLLTSMETEMKKKNIKTAYTIARAMSPGMNVAFSRTGYQFGGRLINNTNISGKIESMNVWHKALG